MWKRMFRMLSLNDPGWGRNNQGGDQRPQRPSDGPPDLDELWRDFNRKLNGLFGSRRGGDPRGPGGGSPGARGAGIGLGLIGLVALLLWLGSGFYIVQEGQAAAVLRFGEFKYMTDRAGFKWRMPAPIESHEMVNVQQLRQVEIGYRNNVKNKEKNESLMLTSDQSIIDMQFAVQYRIGDPVAWLFNNNLGRDPESVVRQSAETAMRQIVGQSQIDRVLYEEKEKVANDALKLMQSLVERYRTGVSLVDVTIQQVQPPEQVQAAFEDANKAAQDRERLINEGRAYANDVIPKAGGTAARLIEESQGYRQRVVATAQGDANRFTQVLTEYAKAPAVTRERLYLETMQQIFSNVSKVFVDTQGNSNLLYLPLDRLLQAGGTPQPNQGGVAQPNMAPVAPPPVDRSVPDAEAARRQGLTRDRDR